MDREQDEISEWPVVEVMLHDLVVAESLRQDGENPEHVEVLAATLEELPPIVVHRATMQPIDGYHRIKAARLRGVDTIAARFFDGDETEAFVLAVRLNVSHGLPLSLADRKRAAERVLRCRPQWSDRRVASVSGISPGTVAVLRKQAAGCVGPAGSRIGQDGRIRPVDAGAGRRRAGELLTQDPSLSLRQVARLAAISPETVRDVRNRLRRGEDLEASSRARRPADGVVQMRPGVPSHLASSPETARRGPRVHGPTPDREVIARWLKADPALQFSEPGRNLLRLLLMHNMLTSDWDGIVTNVPLHCNDIVADLARQFAARWADLAERSGTGQDMARSA
jgi:ParB-like chromosome segregation protein Spo0J